jgi:broad specificity phosphatase PhoE
MTRLILIRHGQSVANEEGRFAGHTNVPLTELGRLQAERAAEYIVKREKIDKIYSSDLCRAHDTAYPTARLLGLPINDVTGLREICAGIWEGRLVADIQAEYEKEFYTWRNDFSNAKCPEGESVEELYNRVVPFVKALARENDGLCLLLASHASPIRAIDCNSRGFGWERMSEVPFVNNSAISIFEYNPEDDSITPVERNITEHLDPSMMTFIPRGLRN